MRDVEIGACLLLTSVLANLACVLSFKAENVPVESILKRGS